MKSYFIMFALLFLLFPSAAFSKSLRNYHSAAGFNYGILTGGPSLVILKETKANLSIPYMEFYWQRNFKPNFSYNFSGLLMSKTSGTINKLKFDTSSIGAAFGITAFTADLRREGYYLFTSAQMYFIQNTTKISGTIIDPNPDAKGALKDISTTIKTLIPIVVFNVGVDWLFSQHLGVRALTGYMISPQKNSWRSNDDIKATLSFQGFHAAAGFLILF